MITAHFTIVGFLTTFKEIVDQPMNRQQIKKELNKRIVASNIKFNNKFAKVDKIFFIDHHVVENAQ